MLALAAAIAIAVLLFFPLPPSIRRYFLAQLLYIPPVVLTALLIGPGLLYTAVYALFTGLILLTVLWLVWEALYRYPFRLRLMVVAGFIAAAFARLAYSGLDRPVTLNDLIVLSEGTILAWSGTVAGFGAPFVPDSKIRIALSFLWLALATFDFGYCLHLGFPLWERLNWTFPPVSMIICCLYVGWRASHIPLKA